MLSTLDTGTPMQDVIEKGFFFTNLTWTQDTVKTRDTRNSQKEHDRPLSPKSSPTEIYRPVRVLGLDWVLGPLIHKGCS